MRRLGLALLAWASLTGSVWAQNFDMPPPAGVFVGGYEVVASCGGQAISSGKPGFGTMDTTGALCISGSFSATVSVSGFAPNGSYANLTSAGTSASVALPTGVTVQFQNSGTTAVSCTLGVGSATATASELVIQPGSTKTVVVGSNTFGACIDQTGSTSNVVVLAGGAGLGNDSGGGGGSSGGGGAITAAAGSYSAGAFVAGTGVDGWNITEGTKADSAYSGSGSGSIVAILKWIGNSLVSAVSSLSTIATNTGAAIPAQSNHTTNIGAVDSISPYPATAVPVTASATGTTTATTATLTNVTSHTTYICGFSIRANATAAATNNATVTGTITGTLNFTQWTAPLASGLGVTEEVFSPCVPASGVSTSIAVVSGAPGSGGVVSVSAWGYSL